jgi:hypothetical protein
VIVIVIAVAVIVVVPVTRVLCMLVRHGRSVAQPNRPHRGRGGIALRYLRRR